MYFAGCANDDNRGTWGYEKHISITLFELDIMLIFHLMESLGKKSGKGPKDAMSKGGQKHHWTSTRRIYKRLPINFIRCPATSSVASTQCQWPTPSSISSFFLSFAVPYAFMMTSEPERGAVLSSEPTKMINGTFILPYSGLDAFAITLHREI